MIKEIHFKDTFYLRQKVMSPTKDISEVKRPRDEVAEHFGYFTGDKLVGVISFYNEDEDGNILPHVWRIRGMAVDQDFQRKGIGAKLVNYGLKQLPITRYWLNSDLDAVNFYMKVGFSKVEIMDLPYGPRVRMEFSRD